MLKKKWIILLIVVLTITLSACTSNITPNNNNTKGQGIENDSTNASNKSNNNQDTNINNTNAAYADIKVTPEKAFDIFTERYPDRNVRKLQLDFEQGSYVYEVEGYDNTKEYELKIDPVDGNILKEQQDDLDNNQGEITIEDVNKIQELIGRALKDAGNGYKIDEWTLKPQNGQTIFSIEVVNDANHDIEYKFNVNTGELIEKD